MATIPNSNPDSTDHWVVAEYEADMFFKLCQLLKLKNPDYASLSQHVRNAVVESALLHTRILIDIFLSRGAKPDDIQISKLLPGFHSQTLDALKKLYGDSEAPGTPCWTLNKMLAHPTEQRSDRHDYSSLLNQLHPLLNRIWAEVQQERKPGKG